jgi:hypothetical protein
LAEEDQIASRSRFGLFSQPPPIGLGDDSAYAHRVGIIELNQVSEARMGNLSLSRDSYCRGPTERAC